MALTPLANGSALAPVIGWLAVAKLLDGLSDVCYGHLQAQGRLREVSRSLIVRGLLSALLLGAAFALTHQVSWAAFGTAAGYLAGLLVYDLPRTRRGGEAWWSGDWPALVRLARLTWPLGVAVGLIALNASLPRYFLGRERGLEAVGVFAALSYVTTAGSMVVTALGQAATTPLSRLAEQAQAGERQPFLALLSRLLLSGTALGVVGVVGSAALGQVLLGLLYGAAYAQEVSAVYPADGRRWRQLRGVLRGVRNDGAAAVWRTGAALCGHHRRSSGGVLATDSAKRRVGSGLGHAGGGGHPAGRQPVDHLAGAGPPSAAVSDAPSR